MMKPVDAVLLSPFHGKCLNIQTAVQCIIYLNNKNCKATRSNIYNCFSKNIYIRDAKRVLNKCIKYNYITSYVVKKRIRYFPTLIAYEKFGYLNIF